jgi:pimeloyl-ACP methyl ester carboxylesterase
VSDVIEREAEIAGTRVVWREAEPRTPAPVLYLHGVPNNGTLWLPFMERTGGIAPDLPGFGHSDKSAGFDYSIPGYAAFLQAFVGHLGHERLSLVVHDWGGVGLSLAQDAPDLVERLVVIDTVPFLPGYRWHAIARIWRTPLLGELFMGSTSRLTMRMLMRRLGALPPGVVDRWVDQVLENLDHGTQRAILRLYRSAPPDVLARAGEHLARVTSPALVVWGAAEPFIGTRFAQGYADALGGPARVEVVDGAGHWPWLDRPEVVDMVCEFLSG